MYSCFFISIIKMYYKSNEEKIKTQNTQNRQKKKKKNMAQHIKHALCNIHASRHII